VKLSFILIAKKYLLLLLCFVAKSKEAACVVLLQKFVPATETAITGQ